MMKNTRETDRRNKTVCSTYTQLQSTDQLLHLMEPVVMKTLKEAKVLPLTVADSLLQLCTCYSLLSVNDYQHPGTSPCLLSSLAELSFACVLFTTQTDDTMESNLDIKNCLFSDVMQLMVAQTSVLEKLLDDLLSKAPDLSHKVTRITTKLLHAFGNFDNPVFYSEAVDTRVNDIIEKLRSQENQSSYFSDLAYQYSLYRSEVSRRKKSN